MTCLEQQAIPRLGTGAIDEAERARLTAHVAGCAQCREGLDALLLAERTLGARAIDPPSELARAAMWKRIDAAKAQPRESKLFRVAIPAVAIAAGIALFVFSRPPATIAVDPPQREARVQVPVREPRVRLRAGDIFERGALRIECVRDAALELDDILSVLD